MSFYIEEYFLEKTPSFGNAIFAINPHIWMIDGCRPKNYVEKVIETITKYYKKHFPEGEIIHWSVVYEFYVGCII